MRESRPGRRRAPVFVATRPAGARSRQPRHRMRLTVGRLLLVGVLLAAGVQLVNVQVFQAHALSTQAEQQRVTQVQIPAQRGVITGREGTKLAFSADSDALSVQPKRIREQWDKAAKDGATNGVDYQAHSQAMADYLKKRLGAAIDEPNLLKTLRSDRTFTYLDQQVEPAVAKDIVAKFPDIAVEHRAIREYPDGTVASNILGMANWRMDRKPQAVHGLAGLEYSMDKELSGTPGLRVVDTESGNDNVVIPGTERDVRAARAGESVQLTIDSDLQYKLHQLLVRYQHKTGAQHGSAVVLDAHTGQVFALTNDTAFNPNDPAHVDPSQLGDAAVTTPYEPGSVNKIVVASAAVVAGMKPDTTVQVPSVLRVADRTIHDDWSHPDQTYTVTGVLAKSSNIGADEMAKRVGPQAFMDMVHKMGLGQCTGIGLPGESCGYVPPMDKWSGSTFANLPIGQGLSMTVLQMAGMYQAIANNGVRVPPRIIKSITKPDGTVVPTPQPAGVRVVSTKQAQTVKEIISHVTQNNGHNETGTATPAALPGYNIAGKTGTAQQVVNGTYSPTKITTTFVGILPANSPRFVVGIMLDAPKAGEGGTTAAPLFHDVAAYLTQRYHIATSPKPIPNVPFVLG
ncbi:MAG: peptidoglycan D,D-transpeptidase FtsI family protein [Sciscionella sp.]